jgi:hypothetical protein
MSLEEKQEKIDPWDELVQRLYQEDPAFCEEYFNRIEVEGPIYGPEAITQIISDPRIADEIRRTGKIPSFIKPLTS